MFVLLHSKSLSTIPSAENVYTYSLHGELFPININDLTAPLTVRGPSLLITYFLSPANQVRTILTVWLVELITAIH